MNSDQSTNPEGNLINFKKAALTHEGRTLTGPLPPDLLLKDTTATSSTSSRKKSRTPAGPRPSKASLKAEREQTAAAYTPEQRSLDAALRAWRKAEAAKTGKPAFIVFSDAVLHNVVLACPTRLAELQTVSGIGPEKADRYGADIIAICRLEAPGPRNTSDSSDKEAASRPKAASYAAAVGGPPHSARTTPTASFAGAAAISPKASTFTRTRSATPEPTEDLTPEQQALDQRLREWRKAESEKLNLPLFFVLASTTLRSIVLARPQTLAQLRAVHGLGQEKIEKFGPGIIEVCNT